MNIKIDFKQSLMHHIVQWIWETANLILLRHPLLSILHSVESELDGFDSALLPFMLPVIGFIHELSHLPEIIVLVEGVAPEYGEPDPGPGESEHAPQEQLLFQA